MHWDIEIDAIFSQFVIIFSIHGYLRATESYFSYLPTSHLWIYYCFYNYNNYKQFQILSAVFYMTHLKKNVTDSDERKF